MSTIYVNKNGSDANNGSTAALAKVTISAGITAAGGGGTVIVGSGSYNELLTVPMGMTMYADGNVVIDGQGSSSNPLVTISGGYSNATTYLYPYTTGGWWIFKNCTATSVINATNTQSPAFYNFKNCILLSNSNSYGIYINTSNNANTTSMVNCVLSGFTNTALYPYNGYAGGVQTILMVNSCTFYNNAIAIYGQSPSGTTCSINQNIFVSNTTALRLVVANASVSAINNNNDFYGNTNIYITGTGTYTTLASVQALGYGWEVTSLTTNPSFLDTTNNIFYPKTNLNPLLQIGAYAFGKVTGSANAGSDSTWKIITSLDSPAQSGTGWYNADTNITQDGTTKDFILNAGTSGVIVSPVYDLGSTQYISTVNIAGTQIWPAAGAMNGKMIDTTSTDIRPNYQTIRVRGQNTAFNQGAASPSWVEVKSDNTFTPIVARYFQIECTLRGDDVGA